MATIKEIKELLVTVKELESPIFLELEKDNRSGVQKEISKRKRAIQAELDEICAWNPCFLMKKNFISKD
ncbi:ribonuclease HII [Streptococcus pneumoniae]|nr:ribonuclease HII [Streptococcus pneumoniae]